MNEVEYEKFYDQVGKVNGWNFSNVRVQSEGVKWNFYEEVTKRCTHSDILLDVGTGGGENVLNIASSCLFLVGVDLSHGMIKKAQSNLEESEIQNVRFTHMSSDCLQFPNGFFDVVSCNHAPFVATEIAKVLKNGGIFLTQQVSEADKLNIKEAFGRGQSFGEEDGTLREAYMQELKEAGFSEVKSFEYDAIDYYERQEDILFLLTHAPIIPNFGQEERDSEIVQHFIETNQTAKGIRTNSKRFLIIAKK
ncbi:class I SAM-dependent methyltransferase [Priestia taiwanensis]|nr:class I SAM-dependent methyltransferase [Priestia taiwanensis]MBM7361650.1 ubiquinone/menaquinone biosynthesis C-methylase UbiE [Priestia taiwanensis]